MNPGIRAALLKTTAFLGAYIVFSSEILSLFKVLTQPAVVVSWILALSGIGICGWRSGFLGYGFSGIKSSWMRLRGFDLAAGSILTILLLLLFIVAVVSPSNNNDALFYHLSRVSHWAQNHSLAHYASNSLHQLTQPIGAELILLNLRLLWGDDKLANLVQFFSFIGVFFAVTAITSLFGGKKQSQWVVIAFAFSLPIALLESTSAQNDLITAFWVVSLLYYIFYSERFELGLIDYISTGLILGLGLLTKATFYFYAILPIAYYCITNLIKSFNLKTIRNLAIVGGLAIILNLGFWARNLLTFDSPTGQGESVSFHFTKLDRPGQIVAGPIKAIAQNFMTPDENINSSMVTWVNKTLRPLDPSIVNFKLEWGWNHEDLAGNPLQVILIFFSLILLLIYRKHIPHRSLGVYMALVLGSGLLLSVFMRDDLYGVRYQLPFFIAWAPVFGISISMMGKKTLPSIITLLLLVSAVPWVLFNRTRPLIAMRDSTDPFTIPCLAGCTSGSILIEPPAKTIFGTLVDYRDSYTQATGMIKTSGCKDVGLLIDSHDPEYLFWWLLDAPQSGIRIETMTTVPELQRYIDPTFKPCAILCTVCAQTNLEGLGLVQDYGGVRLYSNDFSLQNPAK